MRARDVSFVLASKVSSKLGEAGFIADTNTNDADKMRKKAENRTMRYLEFAAFNPCVSNRMMMY